MDMQISGLENITISSLKTLKSVLDAVLINLETKIINLNSGNNRKV